MAVRESRTKVSSWANFLKQLTLSNYLTACAKRKLSTHLSLRTDSFRSMSRQSMTWLRIYRDDSPYECESLMTVPGKNPYVCFHRLRTELLTYLFEVPRAENDCLELLQLTFKALTICLGWALINSLSLSEALSDNRLWICKLFTLDRTRLHLIKSMDESRLELMRFVSIAFGLKKRSASLLL